MWLTNAISCSAEYQLCSVRVEKKAPVKSVKLFNEINEMSKQGTSPQKKLKCPAAASISFMP